VVTRKGLKGVEARLAAVTTGCRPGKRARVSMALLRAIIQ
jgi:hypothetical protein